MRKTKSLAVLAITTSLITACGGSSSSDPNGQTNAINLPQGSNVVYKGSYQATYVDEYDSGVHAEGDATTTVDFENDSLSAEFVNPSGSSFFLEDAKLDGATFSGGELTGTVTSIGFVGDEIDPETNDNVYYPSQDVEILRSSVEITGEFQGPNGNSLIGGAEKDGVGYVVAKPVYLDPENKTAPYEEDYYLAVNYLDWTGVKQ